MSGADKSALLAHARTGLTTLCYAWAIQRRDGVTLAFTDHDRPLAFDGLAFRADSGLSAGALAQSTGLSVDNTEALGALSHDAIREDEIEQGRFDGADVRCWRVNWADVTARCVIFRGSIGEMQRAGGAFRAELRGLTEALNRPMGRVFQKPCTAVLGDAACGFDLATAGYAVTLAAKDHDDGRVFRWDGIGGFEDGWFARGRLEVLDGPAAGLWGIIKHDRALNGQREVELWEPIRGMIASGHQLRLTAGCDKRQATCRLKFNNLLNFRGFPDLPSTDWMMAVPKSSGSNTGGSLR
ncbi:MAG: DUF2163 domain-containing protein [Sulfitobacter litoralis]|jgi:uncharacterized phage protein (TIGR02218 family)|uniref:DUF2163 domain-containing protein n=2 Tax=root TaxID=1 RepID=A0A1H0PWT9_9RHOB|nr:MULTISPECIES: DUF2163 domain-containing protein [Sulfitobacter]MBQ0715934.1 DUF2163 domain-containing protein [Sulfitobacter litoralis]MBQ0765686.1 DUF2163 domain-containing protein [Sulfitobacter litoralis]MBQ0801742.1 DUF2163 domain-containing protein [Sulfitobacter litoralis]MCF7726176.1 DUF2163 domain-containing protein [Sulfitobacter sp. M22]MCF7777553.1 DUF2163 domain-containing protein [Sulfitobacter sp. M220]|tara:strand:+ start:4828 stop:5718 length:891 start_codon:yes stop_codon:yes gene_type:complete